MRQMLVNEGEVYEPAWNDLEPLTHKLPDFPIDALPGPLGRFVVQSSTELQTPPDLQAMFCLSVIASTVARKFKVCIEAKRWFEPVNLYTCSVLDVGNRKSAACSQCVEPLSRYERELVERERKNVAVHNYELTMMQTKLKEMQRKVARGPTKNTTPEQLLGVEDKARELARNLASVEEWKLPEVLADDATPQALEQALYHNAGRIAFMTAEGAIFDVMAGRWNKGVHDLDLFLKGHSGDDHRTNRCGRGRSVIVEPAISFGLSIQPEKIRAVVSDKTFAGLGLLARFLYCFPQSYVGRRDTRPKTLDSSVKSAYETLVLSLCDLPVPQQPTLLRLTHSAENRHDEFQQYIESQLGNGGPLSGMHDWPNKLAGHCLRLAAILHFCQHGPTAAGKEVDLDSIERAIDICDPYLIEHATAVFGTMTSTGDVDDALWIWSWACRNQLEEFSQRDAQRGSQRRFNGETERLGIALQILVRHGYLKELPPSENSHGRPASPRFAVSPLAKSTHH